MLLSCLECHIETKGNGLHHWIAISIASTSHWVPSIRVACTDHLWVEVLGVLMERSEG